MNKHVLALCVVVAILVSALVAILRILEMISTQDAITTLGKVLSIIVVSVVALVLTIVVVKLGRRKATPLSK